ncbi:aldehyde dehydrogenase family protein [Vibrio vulnificus]|uniref:aldehyde dehydrogenase family protein n=1 Tax=Vibrio vulnificus TaxID=672 RepID=UPI00102A8A7F|nr:aldehyde dehydrogenase family protein [Vibrio vulnificus]RZP61088.1 aldehyde dehydrogenase family protein [Vibrio vulnificus]
MLYTKPSSNEKNSFVREKYFNFINGDWCTPIEGSYFNNFSPVDGSLISSVPASTDKDIESAVAAANSAQETWKNVPVTERANLLLKIADRIEQHIQELAIAETWENGKPVRETMAADLPLVVDHFRYFAGCIRAEEGTATNLDKQTMVIHLQEPIGVVGQIIPWNFPLLMAAWKLAPALAAGCSVVLKPAEQTPCSILYMIELIQDLLPRGVVNVVCGFGEVAGKALATNKNIAKVAFTGSTEVGQKVLGYAAENLIPSTVELGGKSPNIFMGDIFDKEDEYVEKCIEGVLLAFFNQGEVCTCPSRLLIDERIYDKFINKLTDRIKTIKQGNPLDSETQVGSQVSIEQFNKINDYIKLGLEEGAELVIGGESSTEGGFFVSPTILKGENHMKVFQEEIFGPVVCVTTFKTLDEAISIANDTTYGLGAGVWTRDQIAISRLTQNIEAGRVWVNCYHAYPAHAAFGGYKKSGIGRETHKMMLQHYQNTKSIILSSDTNPLGFF